MGACTSGEAISSDKTQSLNVDIQQVIADDVWRTFRDTKLSWWKRRSQGRRMYKIEVPMKFYHFEKTGQELSITKEGDGDSPGHKQKSLSGDPKLPGSREANPNSRGLQTHFTNNTEETQNYNFTFEKTRRSQARVSQSRGFSFGGKTDFSINLPKILPGGELGAELDMHMEVNKTEEQEFEEESTTAVTSDVIVPPNSHCVVNVSLEDNHFTAEYKVHVTMVMPSKAAQAFVYNEKCDVVFWYFLRKLNILFPEQYHIKDSSGKPRPDALKFLVQGVLNAVQTSNLNIELDNESLKSSVDKKYGPRKS